MAVINIDDAYILNETGAQVDKVTGLFTQDEGTTEEEKAFAQLNIGASGGGGGGGRNLLDNGWFTIDQTGVTSGAATGGTAQDVRDRWRLARCSEYTFNNDGTVTSKWDGTGAGCYLIQFALLDNAAFYKGKTCTLSFYADGELYTRTITMPTGTTTSFTIGGVSVNIADRTSSDRGYECQFYHSVAAGKTIGPFKLEEGSVSTLANDGPPDYQQELARCQRVFYRIGKATYLTACQVLAENSSNAYGLMKLPVPMRKQPTVAYSGSFLLWAGSSGTTIAVTSITINNPAYPSVNPAVVNLRAQAASGMTQGQYYDLQSRNNADAYLELSCRPA